MFGFKFSTFFLLCGLAFGQLDSSVGITNHRQISISQENAWIDKEGDSLLNTLGVGAAPVTNSVLDITGSLSLKEQASAVGDTVDWGQLWVKNTSPTELWYTDDLGSNFNIGASGGVGGSGTTGTLSKWATASTLTDSLISESGTIITIAGTLTTSIDGGAASVTTALFENTGSGNSASQLEIKSIDSNWKIVAESSLNDSFKIVDASTGNTVIRIQEGAPDGTLEISNLGDIIIAQGSLLVSANDTGSTTTLAVTNIATTGTSSDAEVKIQVWNASVGDPFLKFNIVTIGEAYSIGIDNSDSDKLVISNSSALGTSNLMTLNGIYIGLEKPLFILEAAVAVTDITGYGQTWVKNTTPNELWFTDDSGIDHFVSLDSGTTSSLVSIGGTISLLEQAAADDDTASYGQIWVKNTSPSELWFTDDDGSDFILGGILGSDITGSGTAQKLAVFAGPQTISDSIIAQVTGDIGVNTVLPVSGFDIRDATITLSTSDTDIIATDILGQINFQAPDEASGTDALLAGASIWAEADATFGAAVNNTDLIFATAESETAVEKMRLTSAGTLITEGIKIGVAGEAAQLFHIERADAGVIQMLLENTDTIVGYGASAGFARIFIDGVEKLRFGAVATTFNQGQVDTDFNVRGDTDPNLLFANAGIDGVGIGVNAPTGKLHVDQLNASASIPVLILDQADIDDSFINYIGISAADGSRSISSDTTEDSTKFGAIQIEINGVTKWIRIYDNES